MVIGFAFASGAVFILQSLLFCLDPMAAKPIRSPHPPFYLGNGNFLIIIDSYATVEITSAWPSPFCTAYWVIHWKVASGGWVWGVRAERVERGERGYGSYGGAWGVRLIFTMLCVGAVRTRCCSVPIPIDPYPYPHQTSMRSSMHNCYGN